MISCLLHRHGVGHLSNDRSEPTIEDGLILTNSLATARRQSLGQISNFFANMDEESVKQFEKKAPVEAGSTPSR